MPILRFALLAIVSLTLLMSAAGILVKLGWSYAALCFGIAGITFAPPFHTLLGRIAGYKIPAQLAFYSAILLLPIGGFLLFTDYVAVQDTDAKAKGFVSAGQMEKADALGFATPQQLAEHEKAASAQATEKLCRDNADRPPMVCFEAPHAEAAKIWAAIHFEKVDYPALVERFASRLRAEVTAVDPSCESSMQRIDELAVPVLLKNRNLAQEFSAGGWARNFTKSELEFLAARSRSGNATSGITEASAVTAKLSRLTPRVEEDLEQQLRWWAIRVMAVQSVLRRRGLPTCKPLDDINRQVSRR